MRLLVVGPYSDDDPYHVAVRAAASDEVVFPGAIFDPARLQALRYHSALYLHGHTVGGTNPSLVEAMAAGNAVVAHDNRYNTWVAGPDNAYFSGTDDLDPLLTDLVGDPARRRTHGTGEPGALPARNSPGNESGPSTSRRCTRRCRLLA